MSLSRCDTRFSAEPAVAIKFLISVIEGSRLSDAGLEGKEEFDIVDMAESIEEVRGIAPRRSTSVGEVAGLAEPDREEDLGGLVFDLEHEHPFSSSLSSDLL